MFNKYYLRNDPTTYETLILVKSLHIDIHHILIVTKETYYHDISKMAPVIEKQYCVGSTEFNPLAVCRDELLRDHVGELLQKNDLYQACRLLFKLPDNDDYVYHATASVRLAEVQHIVQLGAVNGLHTWYQTEDGSQVSHLLQCQNHQADIANEPFCFKERSSITARYQCVYFDIQPWHHNNICVEKLQNER